MIDEEEYFRVIEEHFLQKRGNPVLLSPKEWTLIREWYESEIPCEVALRGIDRAFEKKGDEEKEITSLRYCRRLVKSEYKKHLKSLEGKPQDQSDGGMPESKNIGQYLERLQNELSQSIAQARESGNGALADFLDSKKNKFEDEIIKVHLMNPGDLQRVEQQLSNLEQEIEQLLLQMISGEQLRLFKEVAMRELKMFEEKLDLPVYQEMVRRALIKSIRKLYNIPRLSLFYM
jgi:hypothetical protein